MLGSGTSTGIPVVGCGCPVCTSDEPKNRRMRPGLKLELPGGTVVVDTSPDFRDQALRFGLERVDGVLYTHSHADHVFGLDDLRVFNFRQRSSIRCFGPPETMERLRQIFAYVWEDGQEGGGKPKLELVPVEAPFELAGERVVPLPVFHGAMRVYGYRIGDFAVVTDVNRIPEATFGALAGVRTLVLSALRYSAHPTHYNFEEAIGVAARIGAERTIFTHIAHEVDHARLRVELPPGVEVGYDGLVVDLG